LLKTEIVFKYRRYIVGWLYINPGTLLYIVQLITADCSNNANYMVFSVDFINIMGNRLGHWLELFSEGAAKTHHRSFSKHYICNFDAVFEYNYCVQNLI
jgi:hypothetical protein